MKRNHLNNRWARSLLFITAIFLLGAVGFIQPHAAEKVIKHLAFNTKESGNLMGSIPIVGSSNNSLGLQSLNLIRSLQGTTPKAPLYKPGEVLVKFKPSTARTTSKTILNNLNMHAVKYYKSVDVHLTRTPPRISVEEAVARLKKDQSVYYAEPNYVYYATETVPNDPDYGLQWGLHNTGQTGGTTDADIDAPEAWDLHTGSGEVVIAVIDTGVDYNHVDLADNMWTNQGEIPGDGIDNDGNGYVDDVHGINAIEGSGDPMDDAEDVYHGTHCAGIIAAVGNNNIGISGVCWSAKIMALKFLDEQGVGSTSDVIECIEYLLDMKKNHGVNVKASSNSWGGIAYSTALEDAINAAKDSDILFIAAAGNAGSDNDIFQFYPASLYCLNIISVAASDDMDELASFSNFGHNSVDVAAPGVDILSTKLGDDYQYLSGTSMAAPHVAGLAGLICARYPEISYSEVKEKIVRTVDEKSNLEDSIASRGRINAFRALTVESTPGLFIYSLTPAFTTYGDETIIEGTQLGATQGAGYVTFFDNVRAPVISWSDRQIVCTVPEGCQSGPVSVTTNEGLQSNKKTFNLSGSISGRVSETTTGKGLGGVLVTVFVTEEERLWPLIFQIVPTDARGEYSITGLPTRDDYYVLTLNYQGYIDEYYQDSLNAENATLVRVEAPYDTPDINFALEVGGTISGRVYKDDTPSEGLQAVVLAIVPVIPYARTASTDEVGNFALTGLPTGRCIVIAQNLYEDDYPILEIYNNAPTLASDNIEPVGVIAGEETTGIDIGMPPAVEISGSVTIDNDDAIVRIAAYDPLSYSTPSPLGTFFYDDSSVKGSGNYHLSRLHPEGSFIIEAQSDDNSYSEFFDDVTHPYAAQLVTPTRSDIDFDFLQPGSIEGYITAESAFLSVEDLTIAVYDHTTGKIESSNVQWLDSSGKYMVDSLPPKAYRVKVFSAGTNCESKTSDVVTLSEGGSATVNFTLNQLSVPTARVEVGKGWGSVGDTITIPVYLINFQGQYPCSELTLSFDTVKLQLTGISDSHLTGIRDSLGIINSSGVCEVSAYFDLDIPTSGTILNLEFTIIDGEPGEAIPLNLVVSPGAPVFEAVSGNIAINIPCLLSKIYGDTSEEAELLRHFRDVTLHNTLGGQEIIKLYYEWSPTIVRAMEEDEEFKEEIKTLADEILPLIRLRFENARIQRKED